MKRKPRQEESGDSWMNTYSDMVTLLLTFFVLLFSFSSVDASKWQQFVDAMTTSGLDASQLAADINTNSSVSITSEQQEQVDEVLPVSFEDLYDYLKNYVEQQGLEGSVSITRGGENAVYIRFQNNVFFDADSATLRPGSYDVLNVLGDCLHNIEGQIYLISINGHTASVPNPDTYKISDWTLSGERASNIAIFFEDNKGIDPHKLRPIGYGKNYPIATNDTAEGREQNRRVDMTIVKDEGSEEENQKLLAQLSGLFDPTKFPASGGAKDILDAATDPEQPAAADSQPAQPVEEPQPPAASGAQ